MYKDIVCMFCHWYIVFVFFQLYTIYISNNLTHSQHNLSNILKITLQMFDDHAILSHSYAKYEMHHLFYLDSVIYHETRSVLIRHTFLFFI